MIFKKIIDLSHSINANMTIYPGTLAPIMEETFTVEKDGYAEMKLTTVLHVGTHIDAPSHIIGGTKTIDQFAIEKFIGKAIVVNCTKLDEITLDFLKTHEQKINQVGFILFYTGWQNKWNTNHYFDNCPSLTVDAANWLTQFNLKGIGLDAFSVDPIVAADHVTPETLPVHHILLGKEILLIENLTNLDKLNEDIFLFQCLPINIDKADGSPVRAVAML